MADKSKITISMMQLRLFRKDYSGFRDWEADSDFAPAPSKNDSVLELKNRRTESFSSSDDDSVLEPETLSRQEIDCRTESFNGAVVTYQPSGTSRGDNEYFRYSYYAGKRKKHRHIPGGNTDCPVARKRAKLITEAIEEKLSPEEILTIIDRFYLVSGKSLGFPKG